MAKMKPQMAKMRLQMAKMRPKITKISLKIAKMRRLMTKSEEHAKKKQEKMYAENKRETFRGRHEIGVTLFTETCVNLCMPFGTF